MPKTTFLMTAIILFGVGFLHAQEEQKTGSLVGTVIDKTTNVPIFGANVIVVGTKLGAATDADGNF
jgi:hypothetical protein